MYFDLNDYEVENNTFMFYPSIILPRRDKCNSFNYVALLKFMNQKEKEVFAKGQCHSLALQYGSGDNTKNGHNNIKRIIKESMQFFGNLKVAFNLLDEECAQLAKRLEGTYLTYPIFYILFCVVLYLIFSLNAYRHILYNDI